MTQASDPERGAFIEEVQIADRDLHARPVRAAGNRPMSNLCRAASTGIRMAAQSRLGVTPSNARRVLAERLEFPHPLAHGDDLRDGA